MVGVGPIEIEAVSIAIDPKINRMAAASCEQMESIGARPKTDTIIVGIQDDGVVSRAGCDEVATNAVGVDELSGVGRGELKMSAQVVSGRVVNSEDE